MKGQLLQSNIERAIITVKHWKGSCYSETLKGQLLQSNIERAIISQTLKGQLLQLNIERAIIAILQSNIENAIITVKQWKNNYYSQTLKKQLLVKHWKGHY